MSYRVSISSQTGAFVFLLKRISWRQLFVVGVIIHLSIACNDEPISDAPDIVAQVGERTVTARDFQLNYEFGFSSLKKNPDKKRSYLESMINELLLSQEGYRLGLDETERVKTLEAGLLQELLVEELLRTLVSETVTVSDEEIQDAITRSKVRWKFRYWVEPDLMTADRVFETMQEQGFVNVVTERLAQEEVRRDPTDLETDYLSSLDTPPELLDEIKDLQVGEVSSPIEFNHLFFLIQMMDIRREALTDYDYKSTYNGTRQILFQRKLKAATGRYVTEFMTAQNVVVKGDAFQILVDALVEWQQQYDGRGTLSEAIENAGESEPALKSASRNIKKTLITSAGGRWSLEDFITRINPDRLKYQPKSKQSFPAHLKREIALTVRNDLLAKEAISREIDQSSEVRTQLQAWRDKWVYQEMRRKYLLEDSLSNPPSAELADSAGSESDLKRVQRSLGKKLGLLREKSIIRIYDSVLDTISVTDFKKSRWATLFLFKNSSKRSVIPTVDPALGF